MMFSGILLKSKIAVRNLAIAGLGLLLVANILEMCGTVFLKIDTKGMIVFDSFSFARYAGPIMATHANCAALMQGSDSNRHLSDRVIRSLIERGGVNGVLPLNSFLKVGWNRRTGSRREEVPLDVLIAHIDHICQLAGNADHAAIGSDFDGGFGLQSIPPELDSIADLQKIGVKLMERGYNESDTEKVLGGNWLRFLREHLPA